MFEVPVIEYVGYLASILIVISLTMKNIVRLRIINSLGCFCFIIYGYEVGSLPVALSNFAIVIINIYYLQQMKKARI